MISMKRVLHILGVIKKHPRIWVTLLLILAVVFTSLYWEFYAATEKTKMTRLANMLQVDSHWHQDGSDTILGPSLLCGYSTKPCPGLERIWDIDIHYSKEQLQEFIRLHGASFLDNFSCDQVGSNMPLSCRAATRQEGYEMTLTYYGHSNGNQPRAFLQIARSH